MQGAFILLDQELKVKGLWNKKDTKLCVRGCCAGLRGVWLLLRPRRC